MSKKKQKMLVEEIDKISEKSEEEAWNDKLNTKNVEKEVVKEVVDTMLEENKVIVGDRWELVYEPGSYGKQLGGRLELSLVEALLLMKRGRIRVLKTKKPMKVDELFDHASSLDKRFPEKYRVYEDLRERGLLVRTGFKFGNDFRIYERGVQLKKGKKSAKEHTKWIAFAVPEDYTCSFQELSRSIRLAHNIRARMLWAIVDNEGDVTYIQLTRHKP